MVRSRPLPATAPMNCSTCRFELSQCLDGRLPSGRRAIVMQHAASCAECGTFWTELQAAQQLTLQLRRPRVGPDFRDSLWQRIQAGEGTPEAVFHEPVPLVAKLRYALTGAAAAAAALLCAMWLAPEDEPLLEPPVARVADTAADPGPAAIAGHEADGADLAGGGHHQDAPVDDAVVPLLASTQRLGFNLVAVEAAKQLEQRYAGTTMGLHRLASGGPGSETIVRDVLGNAGDFHDFGLLLLDLCDRQRLVFLDERLESDLRFAVNMLAQTETAASDERAVRQFVEPALGSNRLASVSRKIALPPLEPGEERDLVARMGVQWRDTFAKMFVVTSSGAPQGLHPRVFRIDAPWADDELCGEVLVAPRSVLDQHTLRSMVHGRRGQTQVQFRIVHKPTKPAAAK